MEALRTPDDRFAGLPDFPFAPHYVEVADGDGRQAARALPRRGPADGPVVLLHARRAVVVLPVPQDDPGRSSRAGLALHRARPRRLRPLRQADRAHRLHVRAPRRLDARRAVRRARPARRHARRARTGAASSACGSSASTPTASPASSPPTRSCRPATRRRARRSSAGSGSRRPSRTSPSASSSAAAARPTLDRRRGRRRTTRRSPTTRYKAGARQFPMLVPTSPDDPGRRREPQGVGDAARVRRSRSSPRSPTRTRSRAAATACSSATCPGCAGQPHTTIEGGGHFLQEDRGEAARAGRRRLGRRR